MELFTAGNLQNRVFYKKCKQIHLMRIFDAFGIDKEVLEKLMGHCDTIKILYIPTGEVYVTTPETFKEFNLLKTFGKHGGQYFLPRCKFLIEGK